MSNEVNKKIPLLLRFWGAYYNSVPKIYLPGTKFDIAFTVVNSVFIFGMRLLFDFFYQGHLKWDSNNKRTTDCAACSASVIFSVLLCTGLASALHCNRPFLPTAKMSDAPKWWRDVADAFLQLCTAYMFYDVIGMLMDNNWTIHPEDWAFVGHHVVTAIMMTQCRVLGVGHMSSMALMLTGESTNPFQNAMYICRYAIQIEPVGTVWHVVHPYSELIYAALYSVMRLVVGPLQVIHITYHLLFTKLGKERVSLLTSCFWVFIIWGIILGSLPWTFEAIEMLKDGLEVKYDRHFDYGPRFEL